MKVLQRFYVVFLIAVTFCGCQSKSEQQPKETVPVKDTLIIGILPTLDCVPLYMANEYNIYKNLGLYVKFVFMKSQMDIENLLVKNKIDLAPSDLFRTIMWQNKRKDIRFLVSSSREWRVFASKKKRVTKLRQLDDRMIGMTRCSVLDYYCDTISEQIKRSSGLLLKPQINDVFIRLQMMNEGQIDAAILPLPLDKIATEKKHTMISNMAGYDGFAGFVLNNKRMSRRLESVKLFVKAYNMAIDSMKTYPNRELPTYIKQSFQIDSIPLKTIKSKALSHVYHPQETKIASALLWAQKNKFATKTFKSDSLIFTFDK